MKLRPRICRVLCLLRIHNPDCKHCAARLTRGHVLRQRLEELRKQLSPPAALCRGQSSACKNDLEGIDATGKYDPYPNDHVNWLSVWNTNYSHWEGREELLQREPEAQRDLELVGIKACAELEG